MTDLRKHQSKQIRRRGHLAHRLALGGGRAAVVSLLEDVQRVLRGPLTYCKGGSEIYPFQNHAIIGGYYLHLSKGEVNKCRGTFKHPGARELSNA